MNDIKLIKRQIHHLFHERGELVNEDGSKMTDEAKIVKIAELAGKTVSAVDKILAVPVDGLSYHERLIVDKKRKPLKRNEHGECA